ncbi:hypothetical protein MPER_06936, partial [Moniliophthora perniciosa FA553]
LYRVAMIMHPAFKTSYFREKGWPEEWIDQAIRIARETWVKHYKKKDSSGSSEPTLKKP